VKKLPNDEATYREIIEYSFETIVIHAGHKILYINQTGADFLKASKEDLIGGDVLSVFEESEKPSIIERIRLAMDENVKGELLEQTILKMDGSKVDVELYCFPIMFGNQKLFNLYSEISHFVKIMSEKTFN
jgi:two-component system sporulation sensor kinase A